MILDHTCTRNPGWPLGTWDTILNTDYDGSEVKYTPTLQHCFTKTTPGFPCHMYHTIRYRISYLTALSLYPCVHSMINLHHYIAHKHKHHHHHDYKQSIFFISTLDSRLSTLGLRMAKSSLDKAEWLHFHLRLHRVVVGFRAMSLPACSFFSFVSVVPTLIASGVCKLHCCYSVHIPFVAD